MTMRVYECAKKYKLTTKECLALLQKLGYNVANHMAVMPEGAEKAMSAHQASLQQSKPSQKVSASKKEEPLQPRQKSASEEKNKKIELTPQKVKKAQPEPPMSPQTENLEHKLTKRPQQAVQKTAQHAASSQGARAVKPSAVQQGRQAPFSRTESHAGSRPNEPLAPVAPESMTIKVMTVGEFAQQSNQPLSDVIITLLKQGVVATKNQQISEDVVEKLAIKYAIAPLKAVKKVPTEAALAPRSEGGDVRQPIVVVMGHVDHGKTTLLDTIRKTRVAAREKGGITQHLGAYEAITPQGKITFLDTPGHEAFTLIRSRGARIADMAILVVAADDGLKPQSLEAMRAAEAAGIPLIVALNKIDKASPAQMETAKRELSQRGLVPEEWGGQTIIMPISAKIGTGVDALLEIISLQAQMLELHARRDVDGQGFVIESRIEKGLGPIGTVIAREGTIKVGDLFVSGETEGKVSALIDVQGKRVREATPAMPVLVAGFNALPRAGDVFQVVPTVAMQREKRLVIDRQAVATEQADAVRVIVKADSVSSLEAVTHSLEQLSAKLPRPLYIVHRGVGSLSESDITRAADTKALVYGLHVKWEPQAQVLAQRYAVPVHLFDIIYSLTDHVISQAQKQKTVEKTVKKVGEAVVLKVFNMKKMGVIAGAQVKSGIFTRDGKVKIFRGKNQIGEGPITSLQRDRKTVKEVHTGFECAFLVNGFSEWEEGDRVECYQETVVA